MKFIISLLFLTVAQFSFSSEWVGPYPVKYVEVHSNNVYAMLNISGSENYVTSLSGCTAPTVIAFIGEGNEKQTDRILSMLMAAQAIGTKVKFYVSNCINSNYVQALSIASDPNW